MPFDQLRALVIAAIEARDAGDGDDDHDDDGDPVAEFEARPTTYRPSRPPRISTLDDVIESLLRATTVR